MSSRTQGRLRLRDVSFWDLLSIAAAAMRDARERGGVLQETDSAISRMPVLADQVDHYRLAGEVLVGVDGGASREYLRKSLAVSLRGRGTNIARSRREIVDLAYQIDRDFASKLASDIDDDPVKDRLRRQISLHYLKKSMAQERPDIDENTMEATDYSRAAWMRLGALNAGRADHVPAETSQRYLTYASRQPLIGHIPFSRC